MFVWHNHFVIFVIIVFYVMHKLFVHLLANSCEHNSNSSQWMILKLSRIVTHGTYMDVFIRPFLTELCPFFKYLLMRILQILVNTKSPTVFIGWSWNLLGLSSMVSSCVLSLDCFIHPFLIRVMPLFQIFAYGVNNLR